MSNKLERADDLKPMKEHFAHRLQHLLRRRERILRILVENENQIDVYKSNLNELNQLMENSDNETI